MRKGKGTLTSRGQRKKKSFHHHYYLHNILDNPLALWFWGVYIYPQDKGIKCP